jgi:hypothetical protein
MLTEETAMLIVKELIADLQKEFDEEVNLIICDDIYSLMIDGWRLLETQGIVEFEQRIEDFTWGVQVSKYGVTKAERKARNRANRIF